MADKRKLAEWDHAYLWHPFTQMRDWLAEEPLIIERGEGNYLVDVDGRRYLDGVSSLWCNLHGHRHPDLDAALRQQLERVAHSTLLGLASVASIELARQLIAVAPAGLTRVFYSDAGATAVEIALKLAFQYWQLRGLPQRRRFVSLTEAYHGDTLGAVSVGYSEAFHRYFRPLLFEALKLDPPHVFRWQRGLPAAAALRAAVTQAEEVFATHGHEVAALIVEPLMQGAAGMWSHPPDYLAALQAVARAHGTLLICDEVAVGFGRTGRMFAVEHAGVVPDLLCLGKGITGGYMPLAATLATEEIFDAFLGPYEDFRSFFHGHTYTGNALACAVACASLRLFERQGVLAHVNAAAGRMAELLAEYVAPLAHVGDVRQVGLMAGVELVRERGTRTAYDAADRIGARVCQEVRREGVILRPLGPVVVLMPPLSITSSELEHLVRSAARAIDAVTR
jgi:adenosylmethionine-8-amino-7-oxononanoate aminotransferase